ncbi:hypothetical protein ABW20_dc0102892 [Dactylellina cionopaga]|nr:hypothetical protein ABW20_dc0102892 [Dactylellina cionopaga]
MCNTAIIALRLACRTFVRGTASRYIHIPPRILPVAISSTRRLQTRPISTPLVLNYGQKRQYCSSDSDTSSSYSGDWGTSEPSSPPSDFWKSLPQYEQEVKESQTKYNGEPMVDTAPTTDYSDGELENERASSSSRRVAKSVIAALEDVELFDSAVWQDEPTASSLTTPDQSGHQIFIPVHVDSSDENTATPKEESKATPKKKTQSTSTTSESPRHIGEVLRLAFTTSSAVITPSGRRLLSHPKVVAIEFTELNNDSISALVLALESIKGEYSATSSNPLFAKYPPKLTKRRKTAAYTPQLEDIFNKATIQWKSGKLLQSLAKKSGLTMVELDYLALEKVLGTMVEFGWVKVEGGEL